jgi:hypothetical protein
MEPGIHHPGSRPRRDLRHSNSGTQGAMGAAEGVILQVDGERGEDLQIPSESRDLPIRAIYNHTEVRRSLVLLEHTGWAPNQAPGTPWNP